MLLNLIVAALVLLIAYMWTSQGFFSALIHFLCTLAAGAVALTVWEPLVYWVLLGSMPSIAWTVGLVAPFLVTLLVLRVATDKVVTRDPKLPSVVDFAGGGVFGAGSGVISAGVLVIGVGFMPMGSSLLGHQKMTADASGNLVRTNELWVPVDTLTTRVYERLSVGAFSPGGTGLAVRMPGLDEQASLVRATYRDRGRTALTAGTVEVKGAYVVEGGSVAEVTADAFNPGPDGSPKPQDVKRTDGSAAAAGSVLRGYTVGFKSGAAENSGQIIFGPGQVRLVCRLADGTSEGFQPVAVVAQASGRETVAASRYRYDTEGVFIGNASAAKDPSMSFEFVVPADAEPLDLLVKQLRVGLGDAPAARRLTVEERDDAVYSLDLIGRGEEGPTGPRPEVVAAPPGGGDEGPMDGREALRQGVRVTRDLPRLTISRQNRGGLTLNDDREVVSGSHTFATADVTGKRIPEDLKIVGFGTAPGVSMVQVDVSQNERASLLGRAVGAAEQLLAPVMRNTNGDVFEAVGYVFIAGDRVEIRFEPSRPVRAMSELPSLSRSRPNDRLVLLFLVDRGSELVDFTLGGQVEVVRFDPPLVADR